MPVYEALVLGLVQGLSEFLPISSSGHLILTRWLFGWDELPDDTAKAFDVALHAGTLVAVVAYLRADVWRYVSKGIGLLWRRERPVDADAKIAWLLVVATIPAALVGALFEDWIDEQLGTPAIVAVSLIAFGVLLWWADRLAGRRSVDDLGMRDAVVIGAAQALALNPGTSRSGITMTAARQAGFSRDAAARLSFLLSLPVIAGAVALKVGGLLADGVPEGLAGALVVGVLAAALSGWLAVWGTLTLIRTRDFTPFVVYRCALGLAVLGLLATPWR